MRSFLELVHETKARFDEHGFGALTIELHVDRATALRIQLEEELILRVVDSALHPDPKAPERPGSRLFFVVDGVRVYVREDEAA